MQRDTSDKSGSLDGTALALKQFLQELAELTGSSSGESMPVLEFRFDEMVVRISQAVNDDANCLSIILQLPRSQQRGYWSRAIEQFPAIAADMAQTEVLWNADEGCYVILHFIPIEFFADEASVLDLVLDASDQARQWHAALCAGEFDSL